MISCTKQKIYFQYKSAGLPPRKQSTYSKSMYLSHLMLNHWKHTYSPRRRTKWQQRDTKQPQKNYHRETHNSHKSRDKMTTEWQKNTKEKNINTTANRNETTTETQKDHKTIQRLQTPILTTKDTHNDDKELKYNRKRLNRQRETHNNHRVTQKKQKQDIKLPQNDTKQKDRQGQKMRSEKLRGYHKELCLIKCLITLFLLQILLLISHH